MKRAFIIPLLMLFFIITSFTHKETTITLQDALEQKKIDLTISYSYKNDFHDITLEIKNLSTEALSLIIPKGTLFAPHDTGAQTLLNPVDLYVKTEQGETKSVKSFGFCTMYTHHGNTEASTFTLAFTKNPKLEKLVAYIDSTKIADQWAMQNAIWCVTNDHNVSNVYLPDTASSHAFSTFLCHLTGQKSTWYTSEEKILVNEENEFVLEPQTVKGTISFTTAKVVQITGVITDDKGKILQSDEHSIPAGPGKVTFDFELTVEGWPAGTYHVLYTSNGNQVLDQPFTI